MQRFLAFVLRLVGTIMVITLALSVAVEMSIPDHQPRRAIDPGVTVYNRVRLRDLERHRSTP